MVCVYVYIHDFQYFNCHVELPDVNMTNLQAEIQLHCRLIPQMKMEDAPLQDSLCLRNL